MAEAYIHPPAITFSNDIIRDVSDSMINPFYTIAWTGEDEMFQFALVGEENDTLLLDQFNSFLGNGFSYHEGSRYWRGFIAQIDLHYKGIAYRYSLIDKRNPPITQGTAYIKGHWSTLGGYKSYTHKNINRFGVIKGFYPTAIDSWTSSPSIPSSAELTAHAKTFTINAQEGLLQYMGRVDYDERPVLHITCLGIYFSLCLAPLPNYPDLIGLSGLYSGFTRERFYSDDFRELEPNIVLCLHDGADTVERRLVTDVAEVNVTGSPYLTKSFYAKISGTFTDAPIVGYQLSALSLWSAVHIALDRSGSMTKGEDIAFDTIDDRIIRPQGIKTMRELLRYVEDYTGTDTHRRRFYIDKNDYKLKHKLVERTRQYTAVNGRLVATDGSVVDHTTVDAGYICFSETICTLQPYLAESVIVYPQSKTYAPLTRDMAVRIKPDFLLSMRDEKLSMSNSIN